MLEMKEAGIVCLTSDAFDFGCFCLLLYFMCSVSRGRILNQFLIHLHFSLSMRFGRVKSGEKRVSTLPFCCRCLCEVVCAEFSKPSKCRAGQFS